MFLTSKGFLDSFDSFIHAVGFKEKEKTFFIPLGRNRLSSKLETIFIQRLLLPCPGSPNNKSMFSEDCSHQFLIYCSSSPYFFQAFSPLYPSISCSI